MGTSERGSIQFTSPRQRAKNNLTVQKLIDTRILSFAVFLEVFRILPLDCTERLRGLDFTESLPNDVIFTFRHQFMLTG